MIREAVILDELGERRVGIDAFPLDIGGEGAAVRWPEVEPGRVLAYVGIAEGHAFVQPAHAGVALEHNARPVTGSVWLRGGDRLTLDGATLQVALDDATLSVRVTPGRGAGAAIPGEGPEPAVAAARISLTPRRRSSRALSAALLLAFATLLTVAAGVLLATAVSVQVIPEPDQLSFDGTLPPLLLGERYLTLPGSYRLKALKSGYHPLDEDIHVARGQHLDLRYQMRPLPGRVSIVTQPAAGVRLTIDERPLGDTPLPPLELEAGRYALVAEAARHLPERTLLEVQGLGRHQTVRMELTPAWAQIAFSSDPAGAELWVDGALAGRTPAALELMRGEHQVEVRKEGFASATATVSVEANVAQEVAPFVLQPADATLVLASTPDGASVTVDGEFAGRTPLNLALRPGRTHVIRVTRAGHAAASREVTLDAGQTSRLELALAPRLGVVFITADPLDAELLVDGTARGPAVGRHELTATRHAIEIRRDGYASHAQVITPRAGVSQSLDVRLERSARAPPGSLRTAEAQVLELISPGLLQMGASRREPGRRANESLRRVALVRPFFFSVNEVTNGEFRRFDASHVPASPAGAHLTGDDKPVVGVTWAQAARYLNWLSARDGLPAAYEERGGNMVPVRPPNTGYRLPTEAEWAYVARKAGRPREAKYPWTGVFPPRGRAGNFADVSARPLLANVIEGYDDGFAGTAPVASFEPNPVGIRDIGGNVAEWCHDFYEVNVSGASVTDPMGPTSGRHHVVRGSSWRHASISELRLSFRDYSDRARDDLGFRIARYAR